MGLYEPTVYTFYQCSGQLYRGSSQRCARQSGSYVDHTTSNVWRLSVVLWLYDFVLTLPADISAVWLRPKSFVTALYCMNRYTFLLFSVGQIIMCFGGSILSDVL